MIGCRLILNNVRVTLINATLKQVLIEGYFNYTSRGSVEIMFENSIFFCLFSTPRCGIDINYASVAIIDLTTSRFMNVWFHTVVQQLKLILYDVTFVHPIIFISARSHEYLRIPAFVRFTAVKIIPEISHLVNISTSFRVKINPDSRSFIKLNLVNPYVTITESHFSGSRFQILTKRLHYNPALFSVIISNSVFMNSYYEGNGGGLSITSEVENSKVIIYSSTFLNNNAMKGLEGSKGRGGGLYVEANSLYLKMMHSKFINNEADESGLALHTAEGVTLSLDNCSIQYELKSNSVAQKAIIFAAGTTIQLRCNILIANKIPGMNIGSIYVLFMGQAQNVNIEIQCPKFYNHLTQYTLKPAASDALPDLMHECRPCTDNFYTTASENITLYHNENQSILNTLDNGEETKECMQCPYGGFCTGNNVIPRPNYWGYWYKGELSFQQCPAGYCCPGGESTFCNTYNYCDGNRMGTLCGSCQKGFSISILYGECTLDNECYGHDWFWVFAFASAMAYALWYTFKDHIFKYMYNTLASVRKLSSRTTSRKIYNLRSKADQQKGKHGCSGKGTDKAVIRPSTRNKEESNSDDTIDKGYFGIITYYVQMAAVIKIKLEFSDIDKSGSFIDEVIKYIGQFVNIELTKMSFDTCPVVGLTTLGKLLYELGYLCGIYISWTGIYISFSIMQKMFHNKFKMQAIVKKLEANKTTLTRGFIEIAKYTYAGFCGIIFMSLVCTKIGSNYVWWYDATHTCLEKWQVLVIIFALFYAVPFPFVLIFGLKLLKQGKVSAVTFLSWCICPLAALCFYKYLKSKTVLDHAPSKPSLPKASEAIISVLQGPYKNDEKNMSLYWEAMVSIRRLLITSMKLIPYAQIRIMIISVLFLTFTIQHIYICPFKVSTSNDVESLSLCFV